MLFTTSKFELTAARGFGQAFHPILPCKTALELSACTGDGE